MNTLGTKFNTQVAKCIKRQKQKMSSSLSSADQEPMTDDRRNQTKDLMELKCYPRDERDDDRRREEGQPTTQRRARLPLSAEEEAGFGACGGIGSIREGASPDGRFGVR